MALSYDEYYKKLKEQGLSSVSKQEAALIQNANDTKKLYEDAAEKSLAAIQEGYDTDLAETKQAYEDQFKRNEVQKVLNERYLERKAAEMGLTDSGMNRTQMTANQLSHANQQASLDRDMQKAVNTLSATMRANKNEVETQLATDINKIDNDLRSDKANLWADLESSISSQATKQQETDAKYETEAADSLNDLTQKLSQADSVMPATAKQAYVESYIAKYGITPAFESIIKKFGYDSSDLIEKAYNDYIRYYLANKSMSKAEKLRQFAKIYSMYGVPNQDFYRILNNIPNDISGGITVNDLYNAIGGV